MNLMEVDVLEGESGESVWLEERVDDVVLSLGQLRRLPHLELAGLLRSDELLLENSTDPWVFKDVNIAVGFTRIEIRVACKHVLPEILDLLEHVFFFLIVDRGGHTIVTLSCLLAASCWVVFEVQIETLVDIVLILLLFLLVLIVKFLFLYTKVCLPRIKLLLQFHQEVVRL